MVTNILRLIHSVIIVGLIAKILHNQLVSPILFGIQIGLTLLRSITEGRLISKRTGVQIIASLTLGYILFPNKARYISWIFLIKGIEVHQSLKAFRKQFFSSSTFKYIAFIFDVLRFTVCQYIFLVGILLLYKFTTDSSLEPIPQNHVVMYQLAVTASTIGYGDITPKSKNQMIFFTYTIPIICGSFVIYTNCLIEVYTQAFLIEQQQQKPVTQKTQKIQ